MQYAQLEIAATTFAFPITEPRRLDPLGAAVFRDFI